MEFPQGAIEAKASIAAVLNSAQRVQSAEITGSQMTEPFLSGNRGNLWLLYISLDLKSKWIFGPGYQRVLSVLAKDDGTYEVDEHYSSPFWDDFGAHRVRHIVIVSSLDKVAKIILRQ
jgi:hypothetical protein